MSKTNRISRRAVRLDVTWKLDTSMCKAGTKTAVYKEAERSGWTCNYNGTDWFIPVSFLRNEDLCTIDKTYEEAA